MNKLILCLPLLLVSACHHTASVVNESEKTSVPQVTKNAVKQSRCKSMPPIQDKSKLIAMLIKSGDILESDSEVVKLDKLDQFISNKMKGAQKCRK